MGFESRCGFPRTEKWAVATVVGVHLGCLVASLIQVCSVGCRVSGL
jgi:hypothetical protein